MSNRTHPKANLLEGEWIYDACKSKFTTPCFIQYFLGNTYLGAGYIKEFSTEVDRKNFARSKGIMYFNRIKFVRGKNNIGFDSADITMTLANGKAYFYKKILRKAHKGETIKFKS